MCRVSSGGQVGVGDVEALARVDVHEADDDVDFEIAAGFQQLGENAVGGVRAQRYFRYQVLHLVAGQRQLGKDQQVDALLARLLHISEVDVQVMLQVAEFRVHLRQADIDAHGRCSCIGYKATS